VADDFTRTQLEWLKAVGADPVVRSMPSSFRLAFEIAMHVNRVSGLAWPTQETLANAIGATVRTVRTLTDVLEKAGHITVEGRGGYKVSNKYRLNTRKPTSGYSDASTGKPASAFQPAQTRKPVSGYSHENEEAGFRVSGSIPGSPAQTTRKSSATYPEAHFRQNTLIEHSEEHSESISSENDVRASKKRKPKASAEQFENWYREYPRKAARKKAETAYARIIASGEATPEQLIREARRYASERKEQDPQFTKFPATWLNGQCWLDEPVPPPPSMRQSSTCGRPPSNSDRALQTLFNATNPSPEDQWER
jgi:hypothetical protein